jgi:predicted DNA-binding protein (MmcQ/YjbR family)
VAGFRLYLEGKTVKDHESINQFASGLKGAKGSFPFGEETLVFKVNDKMFLLLALEENPPTINVKCDPEKAEELRAKYSTVIPGYHMNKKHWNTVICDGSIADKLIKDWIRDSYDLVSRTNNVKKTTKKKN